MTPVSGDTYGAGEVVRVDVEFSAVLTVTGAPRLALTVGAAARQAAMERVRERAIRFAYTVRSGDVDADGIGVAAAALTLGGGTILGPGGASAQLSLGARAFTANAAHKVNGATATAPFVDFVQITSSPSSGDTYGGGERIDVHVRFGAAVPVTVAGSPAAGADRRSADAPGDVEPRVGTVAPLRLRGAGGGRGCGQDLHRGERADAERRDDSKRGRGRRGSWGWARTRWPTPRATRCRAARRRRRR